MASLRGSTTDPAAFRMVLFFLFMISEYSIPSWDYKCYQGAAESLLLRQSPYSSCYLYPPLLAQTLALLYKVVIVCTALFKIELNPENAWRIVFYLYQCTQYLLVLATYWVCVKFAQRHLPKLTGLLLVTALFAFNNPLFRTLRFNQLNLWILLFSLGAVLLMEKQQFLAGLAIGFGGHMKIYPLILLLPLGLAKKWKTWAGAIAGVAVIFLIQIFFGSGFELWKQYISFFLRFPQGTYFRDNSLHSLVYNLLRFLGIFSTPDTEWFQIAVQVTNIILLVAVFVWLSWRYLQIERSFNGTQSQNSRLISHMMDAFAAMLLLAPMVWEHHYVLAIPIVIWAAATIGRQKLMQLVMSTFFMLGMPTFDFFPFSFHRLAGLIWLLALTSPTLLVFPKVDSAKTKHQLKINENAQMDK